MIKSFWVLLATLFAGGVATLSFAGTTLAANGAEAASEPLGDVVRSILDAAVNGHFLLSAATALVLATSLVRKYGAGTKWFGWTATDWGSPLLVLSGSFGAALASTLAVGEAPSLGMVSAAFGVAVAAAGGWKLVKELAVPLLRKVQGRLPAPARWVVGLVISVFESPGAAQKAEAAGDAAVAADPAPGVVGIVGKPHEVD